MSLEKIESSQTTSLWTQRLKRLSAEEAALFQLLVKITGGWRVPRHVPLYLLLNVFNKDLPLEKKIDYQKLQYLIRKLVKYGLLERFISYQTPVKKKTWLRTKI